MGSERHSETYREEAYELLGELEEALLELEDQPDDRDLVGRVFRAMHTIKGSGAMFGFDEIAAFTHEVESVFDAVREGRISVTQTLIDLTLAARDHIRLLLEAASGGEPVDAEEGRRIMEALRHLMPDEEAPDSGEKSRETARSAKIPEATYRIAFRPSADIFLKGGNPLHIIEDLRSLGECTVLAQTGRIPGLDEIVPEHCYTSWDVLLTTDRGMDAIRDAFIFVEDEAEVQIEMIDEGGEVADEADYLRLGEILLERGDIAAEDLRRVLEQRKRLGESLVDSGLADSRQVEAALTEQSRVRELRRERKVREESHTIRVASEKLDVLVALVGELVTMRANLSQLATDRDDPELTAIAEGVERMTAELHDTAMSIRMVPIGSTFSKFRRLVRDLSRELGREVSLSTEGGDTELDKSVIERLNDPMVHLIRNAIDHGIESPGDREAAGKPRHGRIHLVAMQSGADVLVKISDDGRGLDVEAIRARAVERGLVAHDVELEEREVYQLVFLAGFSTTAEVTGVSGRGVGMDVVKRGIESLRGSVDVDSQPGAGTTITLRIPLTLAIIEGLLIKSRDEKYVLPLYSVRECVELSRDDIRRAHGRRLVKVRGEAVPYIRLRERFALAGELPEREQVVIVEQDDRRVGFAVDEVVGEHQTVIKSLGRVYRNVEGISGATFLGDGSVALILDAIQLMEAAYREANGTSGQGKD